jgi:hypothetical protein
MIAASNLTDCGGSCGMSEPYAETLPQSVAFAICKAKGHDPMQMVVPGHPYLIDGKQFAAVSEFSSPIELWHFYKDEAKAAINAVSDWIRITV